MNDNLFLSISWQDIKQMVEWQNHLICCRKTGMLHTAANLGVAPDKSSRETLCASVSWLRNESVHFQTRIQISSKRYMAHKAVEEAVQKKKKVA